MDPTLAVSEAFSGLGKTPREGQSEVCIQAVNAFLSGKKHVFMDAPTGSGKSIIAVVISKALNLMQGTKAVIVTATNTLAKQYERDLGSQPGVNFVYGAGNYRCAVRSDLFEKEETAEKCYRKSKFFFAREMNTSREASQKCEECEFSKSRSRKGTDPINVTNYAYFILDRTYISEKSETSGFGSQDLFIFDEAQLINEQFASHNAIFFSKARMSEYISECRTLAGEGSAAAYTGALGIVMENIERGSIGEANVSKFLGILKRFYNFMMEVMENKANWSSEEADYDSHKSLYRKYHGLFCKIDDLDKFGFEVAVSCDKIGKSLTVKPIFVADTFPQLESRYNLFLSATLDPAQLISTLKLDPAEVEHIRVPYRFETDDKIIRIPRDQMVKVNFETMSQEQTIEDLTDMCFRIMERHPLEKGVISTTSFDMAEKIAAGLEDSGHRIILHERRTRVDGHIRALEESNVPTVLISPGIFEGVDLIGDTSRFQVITKCPFYSLGDRRNRLINRKHRAVYNSMTVMRLIQVLGRSSRFRGDKSVSYFLDRNLLRAFNSKHNHWKNQFVLEDVDLRRKTC